MCHAEPPPTPPYFSLRLFYCSRRLTGKLYGDDFPGPGLYASPAQVTKLFPWQLRLFRCYDDLRTENHEQSVVYVQNDSN